MKIPQKEQDMQKKLLVKTKSQMKTVALYFKSQKKTRPPLNSTSLIRSILSPKRLRG